MAIQATTPLEYNYGTYSNPYFRLVLHLPLNGTDTDAAFKIVEIPREEE